MRKISTLSNIIKTKPDIKKYKNEKYRTQLFWKGNKNFISGGLRRRGKFKSSNKKPLISVITVVYNNQKYLETCIKSVLEQKYNNVEYIIVDGGSSDNTINIIKEYEKYIDYWISEKDRGIYYAFNKGLKLVTGDIICFVNSDDVLTKNALLLISRYFNINKNADFIFGAVKKHYATLYGYKPRKIIYSWGFYSSHSTGFYIKQEAAKKIGLYNTKYKYSSDYDYFYRMIIHEKLTGFGTKINEITGIFRRGGFSSTVPFIKHFKETIQIRYDNKQNIFIILLIIIAKFFMNFKKISAYK
jgi:glycosyltransferase involved in cell wall biosynthesis